MDFLDQPFKELLWELYTIGIRVVEHFYSLKLYIN